MSEPTIEQARQQAELCRTVGNPLRLLILWSLANGELSVNEITARVGSRLQNVSQHLHLLSSHDLISARREGQHIYYRLNKTPRLMRCLEMAELSDEGCSCKAVPHTAEIIHTPGG